MYQQTILHIISRPEWDAARQNGRYAPASVAAEGFIHCSTAEQVLGPANEFYRGQTNLVLLVIDPARLEGEVVYEDLYNKGVAFPHIYGVFNLDAVVGVVDFPVGADGRLSLPPELATSGS